MQKVEVKIPGGHKFEVEFEKKCDNEIEYIKIKKVWFRGSEFNPEGFYARVWDSEYIDDLETVLENLVSAKLN